MIKKFITHRYWCHISLLVDLLVEVSSASWEVSVSVSNPEVKLRSSLSLGLFTDWDRDWIRAVQEVEFRFISPTISILLK